MTISPCYSAQKKLEGLVSLCSFTEEKAPQAVPVKLLLIMKIGCRPNNYGSIGGLEIPGSKSKAYWRKDNTDKKESVTARAGVSKLPPTDQLWPMSHC